MYMHMQLGKDVNNQACAMFRNNIIRNLKSNTWIAEVTMNRVRHGAVIPARTMDDAACHDDDSLHHPSCKIKVKQFT